jgi:hypothetical protein
MAELGQATPAAAPAVSASLGQTVDADIAALKLKVAAIEAAAKTDFAKVRAWVGTNFLHFVNGAGIAVTLAKVFGKI